ncbi:hypothetical protein NSK_005563 [Nannochloropsis salina CCMP1776]|uniref:ADP-ribosylation factor n=1 Tax=Nannochloropsis salina CCMP1776 TaxID=1027361 RepID=A0A4D9CZT1_9STRA|nr:hypothetical protein NSK_005563 [Nannochloropsis salina CCMP1776]|eukprot:TFJ83143.1 hypothetical protein NSK_005563 [Nannochloropsis salina CCMP1776]
MGQLMTRVLDVLWGKEDRRLLMLGLDAAGKTTILYRLQLGEDVHSIPTIGFNVEKVEYRNISFTIWDVGGQDRLRKLWRHYYKDNDALIFVIDSADRARLNEARSELHHLLSEPQLLDSILLIYANKADLPQAISVQEMARLLQLDNVAKGRPWYVQPSCAVTGDGLVEGLDWLSEKLKELGSHTYHGIRQDETIQPAAAFRPAAGSLEGPAGGGW